MKLTTRFFLILLFIAIAPMFVAVVWNLAQYKTTSRNFLNLHVTVSELAASNVEEWLKRVNKSFAFLYELENPLRGRQVDEAALIKQATATNAEIMALSFVDPLGNSIMDLQSESVESGRHLTSFVPDLFAEAQDSGKVVFGDIICVKGVPYFPLAYPLIDQRTVVMHYSLKELWKKLKETKASASSSVFIVKEDGTPLVCQEVSGNNFDTAKLAETFSRMGKSGMVKGLKIRGVKYSGAYTKTPSLPWEVLSLETDRAIYGSNQKSIVLFVFFAVASIVVSVFTVVLISRKIIKPLENVFAGVKQFLRDQQLEKVIPREGWPEIQNLANLLNRLMLELQAYRAFQLNQIVEEKNKAQALIDTIPDGVLLIDNASRLIYTNGLALRLLGIDRISPDIIVPKSIKRRQFAKKLDEIIKSRDKIVTSEGEFTIDSAVKNFLFLSRQFMLETLKRPGRVIMIRDITHEKELERSKEDFFHMITHDMRAPLSTIQGYVELLMKILPPNPRTDKYFKSMLYSSRRLRGMIDDILNTTKLEKGTLDLNIDEMNAEDFIKRLRENHGPVATPKKISIQNALPGGDFKFRGDPMLLERVVTNLVGNALKFTPAGGRITIGAESGTSEVYLWVEDTGPGVPDDKKHMIFEKYGQMDEHKSMGFGLGLSMCKMTVELHKGKIWVESEQGKGSKFIFTVDKSL